ncbi:MAG: RecX family transcriptional regulator [Novosphingobium sp.]|nr:RecX family transcriptional regulator [Novosphingobium sp.]
MVTGPSANPRRKTPRPIDSPRLEELALAYVARFATSRAKLESYLRRKLREHGWDGVDEPPVGAIADRFEAAGYIDDAAYSRARSGSLLRRGYGDRRVAQALVAAGIAGDVRDGLEIAPVELRRAALTMARKRRFGPFGAGPPDRAVREKQLAAMLRAGHRLALARAVLGAASVEDAERWAETENE